MRIWCVGHEASRPNCPICMVIWASIHIVLINREIYLWNFFLAILWIVFNRPFWRFCKWTWQFQFEIPMRKICKNEVLSSDVDILCVDMFSWATKLSWAIQKRPFMHITIQVQSQSVDIFRYSATVPVSAATHKHARAFIRPILANLLDFCIHLYPFYCIKSRAISSSIYILITRYGDSEISELEMAFHH